jgi:hypothetical protein
LVKRTNYSKKTENGIGLHMVKLTTEYPPSDTVDSFWYQVSESEDERDILCSKWTNTLLLGTSQAAAVIVKVLCPIGIYFAFMCDIGERFI